MCRRLILVAFFVVFAALHGCAGGFPGRPAFNQEVESDDLTAYSTSD